MAFVSIFDHRPRRERAFHGNWRWVRPARASAKRRITRLIDSLVAEGALMPSHERVLRKLLWTIHNGVSGVCFPSYARIAAESGLSVSTVKRALKRAEELGVLTWVHRYRPAETDPWRVVQTSNGYRFNDPGPAFDRPRHKGHVDPRLRNRRFSFPQGPAKKAPEGVQTRDYRAFAEAVIARKRANLTI